MISDNPKIAIVYDRVNTPYGGAEKLLLSINKLYPKAPLYTSLYNPKKAKWADVFEVRSSFLNKIPLLRNHHQLLAFLMPLAFESFDFSQFDLVISITSAEAKGIITRPETKHLSYLLTPPRYLYSHRQEYLEKSFILSLPIIKYFSNKLLDYLTRWDQIAIHRPDKIIPISNLVKDRAKEYYKLTTSQPIYPAIVEYSEEEDKQIIKDEKENKNKPYLLMVTRLVPYKKIDLAIKACQELNQKLVIVGSGKEKDIFKNMIYKANLIDLAENVSEEDLENLYQNCQAVLMPGEEDFGIVALEALSHQKPVIINANSGAAELIEDKKTGLLLKSADLQDIKSRILEVEKYDFKPAIMSRCLSQHNTETFKKQFKKVVNNALKED
ncbi:MAG: glycosyltransferase family 4 protein [Candidatus Pacebacteria bacterium]|nr:glycosyltransferase family 4 protein [Candidatus Paceibacterota bacterium]